MPSQFFGLNIAYSGLLASNAALNTTSNNIANVETQGYSRQNAEQSAANAGVSFVDNLYGTVNLYNANDYLIDNVKLNKDGKQKLAERFVYALQYYD